MDFFHEKEKAIRLKAENVEIATHHICCDPITNLINGKTKVRMVLFLENLCLNFVFNFYIVFYGRIHVSGFLSDRGLCIRLSVSYIALWEERISGQYGYGHNVCMQKLLVYLVAIFSVRS